MKKTWSEPALEILDMTMTMAGPGLRTPDEIQPDPDPEDMVHYS